MYGVMLTASSAGGVVGPLLISTIRHSSRSYDTALYIIAGILAAASIIPFLVRPPRERARDEALEGVGGGAMAAARR